jgi:mannitol/fructose-specific phosphotransferase system IIA component (Ntr-type)
MRESGACDEHMKVFSRLAWQIMHEHFRDRLEHENNFLVLCDFLRDKIGSQ